MKESTICHALHILIHIYLNCVNNSILKISKILFIKNFIYLVYNVQIIER